MIFLKKNNTVKDILEAAYTAIYNTDIDFGEKVTKKEVLKFLAKKMVQEEKRLLVTKKKRETQKKEGDEFRNQIKSVMRESYFMTIDEIRDAVIVNYGLDDITRSQVMGKLRQLVDLEEVNKAQTDIDGRRIMVYSLAAEPVKVQMSRRR